MQIRPEVSKTIKKPIGHFLMFVIIILLIAIIFITVGWAANQLLDEDKPLTLDDKRRKLKTIEEKLMQLQIRKEEIKRKEKQIFLFSRLFIAIALLLANYFYMKHYKIPFDLKRSSNELLRFNSLVLLAYSFIAFISYGTPAKFVDSLKSLITSLLQKFNIDTYNHYERLVQQRTNLIMEIEIEEKK